MLYAAARAKWNVADSISCAGAVSNEIISAPATAAAANSIPKNSRPLPKNTVAKNLSSLAPKRSRSTPMNHRNAIPANGTRLIASATVFDSELSHAPGSRGSSGTEFLNNNKAPRRSTENIMPAIAAALGVFRFARVRVLFSLIHRRRFAALAGIIQRECLNSLAVPAQSKFDLDQGLLRAVKHLCTFRRGGCAGVKIIVSDIPYDHRSGSYR